MTAWKRHTDDKAKEHIKVLGELGLSLSGGLCDQLEQATKQTAAEIKEMRRQEPSVESSDGNDDSTAFFQDFLEGKKIVGLSM